MTVPLPPPIGAAELQKLITDVDRSALLAPPRLVRRVIKQDRGIGGVGLQVPHRKSYTIGQEALLEIANRDELGISEHRELPEHVILLACPDTWLATHTRDQALVRFWRLLFHARIDLALEEQGRAGHLDESRIRAVLNRIGFTEAEEVFHVLHHENFLLPPADLFVRFVEFVALYFELRYFARPLVKRYFPAIVDHERVERILREVIDVDRLFAVTRLEGAPEPVTQDYHEDDMPGDAAEKLPPPAGLPSAAKCQRLLDDADRVAARGNVVRSAILRLQAADVAPPEMIDVARKGALADVERLVTRLQAALELRDREVEEWRATLPALLGPACSGLWPPAARLLYDLQKVCVDYERDLYSLDIIEWIVSLFRIPIKRHVPLQADVLLVKHLRSAAARLAKAQISDEDRHRLGILLRSATHTCEERLREKIRPKLSDALREVGFVPANPTEEVALRKVVEELLDRIVERGFLTMGDLRDAISRNQLKLDDTTPGEIILGDRLMRANRKLALDLDGVYRRGEIYLRWLQRFTSLQFGTVLGRVLTRYVIMPFGGAFALLVFALELMHIGVALGGLFVPKPPAPEPPEPPEVYFEAIDDISLDELVEYYKKVELPTAPPEKHEGLPPLWRDGQPQPFLFAILVTGTVLLGLLYWPAFRKRAWQATCAVGCGLHVLFVDAPAAFFSLPSVHGFLASPFAVFVRQRILVPLMLALVGALICARYGLPGISDDLLTFFVTFALTFLLLGSRLGRATEEALTDWLARNWYWLRVDVLPGLVGLILFFFKEALDRIERLLYTVDEWLRFRPGDSRLALVYKPILGFFWFFITYLIRVVINLFVEPTVNPIKHFPAVTVGAKLIVPFYFTWTAAWALLLQPYIGLTFGKIVANGIFILLPGICGFAVWEFKENWKLYRVNRAKNLRPVMIGHHGETMVRFLKPGFHSGTLPKLYARLRRVERRGDGRKIHRFHEALHHAAESIGHFIERELLFLLEQSPGAWGGLVLLVGEVKLATNRVRVELRCRDREGPGLWLAFEERSGQLLARVEQPGWLDRLNDDQRAAFAAALAGLYKLAGVTLVHEQVEASLPAGTAYTVDARGLVLFPAGNFAREEVIPLTPAATPATPPNGEPTVPLDRILFGAMPIAWFEWVSAWAGDRVPDLPLLHQFRVLPALAAPATTQSPVTVA